MMQLAFVTLMIRAGRCAPRCSAVVVRIPRPAQLWRQRGNARPSRRGGSAWRSLGFTVAERSCRTQHPCSECSTVDGAIL